MLIIENTDLSQSDPSRTAAPQLSCTVKWEVHNWKHFPISQEKQMRKQKFRVIFTEPILCMEVMETSNQKDNFCTLISDYCS